MGTDYEALPVVMSVEQLAETLQVGRNTAYSLVRSGRIKSVRVGRQIRVPRGALEAFLEEK